MKTHGLSKTAEYRTWQKMKRRTTNVNSHVYHLYGGRGIKVHKPWADDFVCFYNYLCRTIGRKPPSGYSLDRKDNDGNYEPGNIRWATQKEQVNNSRHIHYLEYQGIRLSVAQWADRLGMARQVLYNRLKKGWTVERTLSERKLK